MKVTERNTIIDITYETIKNEAPDELYLLDIFSESMLDDVISGGSDSISEHSHFGDQESLYSYYLLGIIAWISTKLANEGVKLAKFSLYQWIINNKDNIKNKYKKKNPKYLKALNLLEKYLEKENSRP